MLDGAFIARKFFAGAVLLSALGLLGCATTGYVEADVPVNIEAYPSAYYDGQTVYWVGDRWYAYHDGAWIYYRTEPRYLRRYRRSWGGVYYRPAPYYYHPYHRVYRPRYYPVRRVAPPVRNIAPPVRNIAPPARNIAPPGHHRR